MFQKFTEKAINSVKDAQKLAIELCHKKIYPEHLLIAIASQSGDICSKILKMHGVNKDDLKEAVIDILKPKEIQTPLMRVVFSVRIKKIFQKALEMSSKSNSGGVLNIHLLYALLTENSSDIENIFDDINVDYKKVLNVVQQIVEKKDKKAEKHPEGFERRNNTDKYSTILSMLKESESSNIFNSAVAKLTTSEYEILGTEQIIQSILEDDSIEIKKILNDAGITSENFSEKLNQLTSRQDEYADKQIILTPNALKALLIAVEISKELGTTSIKPEHIVLGVLKAKKGIAYNIITSLCKEDVIENKIIRPIEKPMNETPLILQFAKQEARRMGQSTVGTEMILLGIMLEGTCIAAQVLEDLGFTVRDLRKVTAEVLNIDDNDQDKDITFTPRAKLVLEEAWQLAKKEMKTKIYSEHLLEAICNYPSCLASKVLSTMGTDAMEIRQGIRNKVARK